MDENTIKELATALRNTRPMLHGGKEYKLWEYIRSEIANVCDEQSITFDEARFYQETEE